MTREQRLQKFGPILTRAFVLQGLPGAWGLAFARQESDFDADAQSHAPGDKERGGSWGLCQMSAKTAHDELGFKGEPKALLDPAVNAELAARYVRMLATRARTDDLAEVAARYNSGRGLEALRKLAKKGDKVATRVLQQYVAHVVQFAEDYRAVSFLMPV